MIKEVVFDWSGVINDNTEKVYKTAMTLFVHFGVGPITLEEFRNQFRLPFMRFYNNYVPDLTIEEERRIFNEEYAKLPDSEDYPGIVSLLHELKDKGIALGVISSDNRDILFVEAKRFGLEGVFTEVMADVHDKLVAIQKVVERSDFNKQKILFIGDMVHEIESGKSVGVLTGAVTWGINTERMLKTAKPDYIFRNADDIRRAVFNS